MDQKFHIRLLAMVLAYAVLRFLGGSFGNLVLYPVTLLVTFLHEFGHALGALLTGGSVESMQISADGSGYTVSRGGSPGIILIGGYLGSAALGNVLFRIGARHRSITQTTLVILACVMVLAGIAWFESFQSTALLTVFGALLFFVARKTDWDQDALMFLGLAAVLYIIQDFNVGPGSDLAMYEQTVGVFSSRVWMYIWLGLAAILSCWNLRAVLLKR